jgi:glycosyltransferase involved in cell wall biosynthesis
MREPRVLVFSTVFPSPANSTHGLFVWQRMRRLAAAADLRIVAPVSFWRTRQRMAPRTVDGVRIYHPRYLYIPRFLKWLDGVCLFFSSLSTVARLRREFPFELIDAHFAFPEGFAAVLLGAVFRCPVVITERGTLLTFSPFPMRRALADWALRHASRVIAVAEPLARRVRAAGVPSERTTVIGNGVDIAQFHPRDRRAARLQLGIAPEGPLLVSVGHLSKRKGFDRVLRVFETTRARQPDARLAIVGGAGIEGDEHDALVQLAEQLGVRANVVFTGALPPEGVAAWLAAADLFVFASDYEGCPNVLWEALASGCPVVTSDVGDAAQIVPPVGGLIYGDAHDAAAFTAAVNEALARRWDHDAIRAYAEQHTWERVAERVFVEWDRALRLHDRPFARNEPI